MRHIRGLKVNREWWYNNMSRKNYVATHRCEKLLKQNCSIRYGFKYDFSDSQIGWFLRRKEWDSEYDTTYLGNPIEVEFCPMCGCKLNIVD